MPAVAAAEPSPADYRRLEGADAPHKRASAAIVAPELSFWGAVGSLLVSMVGGGIVAFPYAFALCGYIGGSVLLLLITVCAHEAYCALSACCSVTGHASYDGLLTELPPVWGRFSTASLALLLVLASVLYILVAADQCRVLLQPSLDSMHVEVGNSIFYAGVLTALFPLCLTRSLGGLASVTTCCFGCIMMAGIMVVGMSAEKLALEAPESPPTPVMPLTPTLCALPILATALFGHMNFPRICAELGVQGHQRAPAVSRWACALVATLYAVIGLAGYAALGGEAPADIVAALAQSGLGAAATTTQVLILIFVILKTPFLVFPLRSLCLSMIAPQRGPLAALGAGENVILAAALLGCIFVAALVLPDLGVVMDILGAVCAVPLTFVVPARLSVSLEKEKPIWRSACLGAAGVATSVLSLYAVCNRPAEAK